jgi:hypothetical protein
MTRAITITFIHGPGRPSFEDVTEWAKARGLEPGPVLGTTAIAASYFDRAGDVRLEVSHRDPLWVTFSTNHPGTGDELVTRLALEFWAGAGGSMLASAELRDLILARFDAVGNVRAALQDDSWGALVGVLDDIYPSSVTCGGND